MAEGVTEVPIPTVPLTVKSLVTVPAPTTYKAVVGLIVPIPTLPEELMVMPDVADPPVIKPILFEPIRYSPVSVSLVKVKEGAAAVPSASCMTPDMEGDDARLKVTDPPRDTSPPPERLVPAVTVTLELVRPELGILVKVFDEPDKDLFVNV